MSANGAGERQNAYRLDGASNTDPYYQENQSFPFPDALQEFSIQTSNYSAQHGNNAGAVVNVVTRSGTNSFHGGAFEYIRDRKFNSKDYFAAEKDFLKRNQYGGFVGGPIRTKQHVLLRRLAAHAHHEQGFGAHPVRADGGAARAAISRTARRRVRSSISPTTGSRVTRTTRFLPSEWDPAAVKVFAALPTSTARTVASTFRGAPTRTPTSS